jgi:hypothetical protein
MSQQILPPMTRTSFKARIQQLSSTLSLSCGLFLLLSLVSSSFSRQDAAAPAPIRLRQAASTPRRMAAAGMVARGRGGMEARGGGVRLWGHGGSDRVLPTLLGAPSSLSHGGARRRLHHEWAAMEQVGGQRRLHHHHGHRRPSRRQAWRR